jgi:hypothetical protein
MLRGANGSRAARAKLRPVDAQPWVAVCRSRDGALLPTRN